ncbi:hypothetical protein OG978_39395 [Streptomyces sp. NBC_01591]|nr:hypothetical protein [Streptomyces sp. NBC_01591]WSD72913.1 hypothetical protein OG978_39395 [Streptomyces sp. NBC_01591]
MVWVSAVAEEAFTVGVTDQVGPAGVRHGGEGAVDRGQVGW